MPRPCEHINSARLLRLITALFKLCKIDLEASQYEIIQRGGYMAGSNIPEFQHLLKKSVYMLKTGSLIAGVHKLKGKIADITPAWNDERMHPVLRCGCPIVLPIKKQKL